MEKVAEDPPTFFDVAHNPAGAAALAEALPEVAAGRPVIACLAILAGKDAAAMVKALAPALERAICTELPVEAQKWTGTTRRLLAAAAAELAELCRGAGLVAEAEVDFGGRWGALGSWLRTRWGSAGHRVPLRTGARRDPALKPVLCEDSAMERERAPSCFR